MQAALRQRQQAARKVKRGGHELYPESHCLQETRRCSPVR
jgi:hypothetical protein